MIIAKKISKEIGISTSIRYLFLAATILLTSCEKNYEKTILFIGDSITKGWDTELFFPEFTTSKYLYYTSIKNSFNPDLSFSNANTIVILIGNHDIEISISNDAELSQHVDNFGFNYKKAVQVLNSKPVVILSILPCHYSDKTKSKNINRQIDLFNEELLKIANELSNVVYIDVNSSFKDKNGDLDMNFSTDGIHLNVYGYRLLSKQLDDSLINIIQ